MKKLALFLSILITISSITFPAYAIDLTEQGSTEMDSKMTYCQLFNANTSISTTWGINTDTINMAWKMKPYCVSFSYSGGSDYFSVSHNYTG